MFKDMNVLGIVLLPFNILVLAIFLFLERLKGIPIETSLNNLVYDDYSVCDTRCCGREL